MGFISQININNTNYSIKDSEARTNIATVQNQIGNYSLEKSVPANAELTDTWIAMTGATANSDGTAGYAPAPPSNGYDNKYLRADGTWSTVQQVTVDSSIAQNSTNPVQSGVIYTALDGKADANSVGTLSNLQTTVKTDLVTAVNELCTNFNTLTTDIETLLAEI